MSTVVGASDCGIAGKEAVAGFWMITVPPAWLTARAPAAPSEPMPVRMTAISRSPYPSAAVPSSRSIDGLGRPAPSTCSSIMWSSIET